MKILVLSDSHGLQYFMQRCVEALQPDAVIHLGDMVRDADKLAAQYPGLRFYQVAGNCDLGRDGQQEIITLSGARLLLTHGHRYQVRQGVESLLGEARQEKVQAALYGHTHLQKCQWEGGLLLLNPGAAMDGRYAILRINRLGAVEAQLH